MHWQLVPALIEQQRPEPRVSAGWSRSPAAATLILAARLAPEGAGIQTHRLNLTVLILEPGQLVSKSPFLLRIPTGLVSQLGVGDSLCVQRIVITREKKIPHHCSATHGKRFLSLSLPSCPPSLMVAVEPSYVSPLQPYPAQDLEPSGAGKHTCKPSCHMLRTI